jgi:hypothetical protein
LFWLGLSLGCFAVAIIHHLTGGQWGNATRRFLEAGFMTLPLMALLFVPIFFGLTHLYPWARPETVAADKVLLLKAAYSNTPWFVVRAIFCFGVWIIMALCLRKWSLDQDQTTHPAPTIRLRTLSGPGIIIYALTVTLAYTDWVLSLEPDWYSTMFLVIVCIGQILAAYAFAIICLACFKNTPPVSEVTSATTFHHLGNLLLAFVIFWTYVCFGQFLIIWAGNLPQEIGWYLHRSTGGWQGIILFLVVFHFFLPFLLLLFRTQKRHARSLAILAGIVLVARVVDVFWMIMPSIYQNGIRVNWLDFAAFFGIGGFWMAVFFQMLKRARLAPQNDPRMQPELAYAK